VSSPNPQAPGFYFEPVEVLGAYYPVVSPLTAAAYDFPASATVSIYLGSTLVGNVTTDANGFGQLPVTATLPAIPAGTYTATAVDASLHLVATPTTGVTGTITVSSFFEATDPVGNSLYTAGFLASVEYVPQNGTIMVSAYGLAPGMPYTAKDSVIGNIALYGTNVTVTVGSIYYTGTAFVPAANGTLIFTYQPFYGYYGITTGTSEQITLGTVAAIGSSTVGFFEIGAPMVTVSTSSQQTYPGASATVTFSNLIGPSPSPMTFYPGTSGYYNLYIGTSKIVSSGSSVFTASSSPVSFTVPSLASGLYNISITYSGQPISMALPVSDTETAMVVVSTAGSSTSSGGITTVSTMSDGAFSGYVIAGFGLLASTTIELVIYSSSSPTTGSVTTTSVTGSFFDSTDLAVSSSIYSSSVAGTYGIVLSVGTGTSMHEFYSSYVVYPTLSFKSTFGGYSGPVFYDFMNDVVTLIPTGLSTGTYYDLYFGSMYIETVTATSVSTVSPDSFNVPVVPAGLYYVNLTYTGTSKVVVSEPFYVLPSYYGTMTVMSAQGIPTEYAFPGQILSFAWTPSVEPQAPGSSVSNSAANVIGTYGPIYVTVYLNGSAYTTLTAGYSSGTLSGSFLAPNAAIGSYWDISLSWSQNLYTGTSNLGAPGSPLSGATVPTLHFMSPVFNSYLGLVQGNGALLTAISQAEIATIEAQLTSAVTTSLQVPLSELSANITALHGDIATITTSFGTMTATLQAINATVSSVSSGVVLLQTELGTVKASLASLNATIVSLNGTVATLSTSLGKISTSVSSINATVTSISNGVATVQTSLGTLTGTVMAINGTVATIHTALGQIQANVSAVKTSTSGFTTLEIFLIVAIVLILITLVIAFLAVSSSNKLAKKIEEQKKQ
jgi:hypothetical protein